MTLKQALWEIVRDENIIITNQNIDWLLDRAEKRSNDNTNKNNLKGSILERKAKLDKLGESENKSNEELFKKALVEGVNRHIDKTIEEEKQIEEMARVAYASIEATDMSYFGIGIDEVQCNAEAHSVAQELYKAGYRKHTNRFLLKTNGELIPLLPKQSEGEWIVDAWDGEEWVILPYIKTQHTDPFCSECYGCALHNDEGEEIASAFCPHCGAKMKGGEE